jgi:hypothetical protein
MAVICKFSAALACALAWSAGARADEAATPSYETLLSRRHTVAMLQGGIIALPGAPISTSQRGGNTPFGSIGKGDATVEAGVNVIFRVERDWSFGAGVLFGPKPTSDTQYGGTSGLPRTHSRSYLVWGVEGRWLPIRQRYVEGWLGLSAGEVILADRFDTDVGTSRAAILGSRQVTVRSEGFATGLQIGADWLVTEHVVVGISGRGNLWLLPSEQACTPIGDCATLSGAVFAFELGLSVGYRIPLF